MKFSFRSLLSIGFLLFTSNLLSAPLTIYTEELPPLNYEQNGELVGLSVEIVEEIQRRTGNTSKIQIVPWARGYKSALEQPNTVLFSTTRTEEREKLFKWVGPLADWSYVFYKKRGTDLSLKSLDDARNVESIATYRDDAREQFLKQKGFINLDSSPKLISCARKLMEGRVDLWLDSNLTAHQIVQNAGYDPADLEPVLSVRTNHLYIAFSRSTEDSVVSEWQNAFSSMVQDGSYEKIYKKWLPEESPPIIATLTSSLLRQLGAVQIYTEDLEPINYLDQGKLTGVSTEIVHEILRRIGMPSDITIVPWARGYKHALEQRNVALFSTVRSPQRENQFKWVGPIATGTSELFAKSDSNLHIENLEDAKTIESIGTYNDDVDEQFLKEHGFENIYSHKNPVSVVRNLMSGRIQLWIASGLYAPRTVVSAGYLCSDVKSIYTIRETYYYIAFSRHTSDEVVKIWQQTLDSMRQDGTLDAIREHWEAKEDDENRSRGCRA